MAPFRLYGAGDRDGLNRADHLRGGLRVPLASSSNVLYRCVRTTLTLDEELLRDVREHIGIEEQTALNHEALPRLIRSEAARRLIPAGGTMPKATSDELRRPDLLL